MRKWINSTKIAEKELKTPSEKDRSQKSPGCGGGAVLSKAVLGEARMGWVQGHVGRGPGQTSAKALSTSLL